MYHSGIPWIEVGPIILERATATQIMSSSEEKLPARSSNMPEIAVHIIELNKMHKVAAVELREFSQPKEFFDQTNKVQPTKLSNNDTTPA